MAVKQQSTEQISLTKEQQTKLIEFWNSRPETPPRLKEMIEAVFGAGFDGRSNQGIAVKKFLVQRGIKPLAAQEYVSKTASLSLREDQKEFIANNASLMTPTDIAKVLFKEPKINNLSAEARLVASYIKTIPITMIHGIPTNKDNTSYEYKPPKTFEQALARINRYIFPAIDKDKLAPRQKNQITVTMNYLHNYRFRYIMKALPTDPHRELFESTFIGYIYDKDDLSVEQLNLYMNLALDIVHLSDTQSIIHTLTELQKQCATDSDGKKMSMALAEAIHHAQGEYNQNKQRQQKLVESLAGRRAEMLDLLVRRNASILNLVELWTEEKERDKMLQLAKLMEDKVTTEMDKLSSVDDLKARFYGITRSEVLGFEE